MKKFIAAGGLRAAHKPVTTDVFRALLKGPGPPERVTVQTLVERIGGACERTEEIEYEPATRTFHYVTWWSDFTCRGEPTGSGNEDDVIPTTGELIDRLRAVRPDLAEGLVVA